MYATSKSPGNIDKTIDFIQDKYDITLPLSDFVLSRPYDELMEKVTGAYYAGLTKWPPTVTPQEALDSAIKHRWELLKHGKPKP